MVQLGGGEIGDRVPEEVTYKLHLEALTRANQTAGRSGAGGDSKKG